MHKQCVMQVDIDAMVQWCAKMYTARLRKCLRCNLVPTFKHGNKKACAAQQSQQESIKTRLRHDVLTVT